MKKIFELIKYNCFVSTLFLTILYKLKFVDKNIIIESIRRHKARKLKKVFSSFLNNESINHTDSRKRKFEKVIWTCWFQGEENAPLVVKKCLESIKKHANGWKVIVLNSDNLCEYISLPESIINKWKSGVITNTHFSDILRCALLVEHGGIWMDSTCLLTADIPKYVFSGDFFCFKHKYRNEDTIELGSWFLFSVKNNPLLSHALLLEIKYWEKYNKLADYFLFHIFVYILKNNYLGIWNFQPNLSDVPPHELNRYFCEKYDSNIYEIITNQTFVQKLTYKFNNCPDGSFVDEFLKGRF